MLKCKKISRKCKIETKLPVPFLYKAQVSSTMEYCSPSWIHAAYANILDHIQKRIIWLLIGMELLTDTLQLLSFALSAVSQNWVNLSVPNSLRFPILITPAKSNLPRLHTNHYIQSFFPRISILWNSLALLVSILKVLTCNCSKETFMASISSVLEGLQRPQVLLVSLVPEK